MSVIYKTIGTEDSKVSQEKANLFPNNNQVNKQPTQNKCLYIRPISSIEKNDEKINEEEEILNEIEYILSILDTKLDNLCYLIKDIKNHLILYNRYIKQRRNSKKINPSSIPFKSFEKNIIKYNINYFSILKYEPHEIGEALISMNSFISFSKLNLSNLSVKSIISIFIELAICFKFVILKPITLFI